MRGLPDPLYPLHQLRGRCVAIVFLRTAAAAERENWHARFKRNRNPTISTDWARLNATRLWRCNAARRIHWYAIEAIVVTYWVFNQKRHTMTIRIKSGEPGFLGFSVPKWLGGVICKPEGAAWGLVKTPPSLRARKIQESTIDRLYFISKMSKTLIN